MTTPNLEFEEVPKAIAESSEEINFTFRKQDALIQCAVLSATQLTPPQSPVQGMSYIVPDGATGIWTDRKNRIAYYTVDGWRYITPRNGFIAVVIDDSLRIWQYSQATNEWAQYNPSSGVGGSNLGRSPDDIPESASAADDEFEIDGAIDTVGSRFSGAAPWAWRNQGASTASNANGALILTAPGTASLNLRVIEQIAPSAPWTYRAKISAANSQVGMSVANNGTGQLLVFHKYINTEWSDGRIGVVQRYTDATTFSASASGSEITSGGTTIGGVSAYQYFEVENDGTNLIWRISTTGHDGTFFTCATEAISAFVSAVDRIGLFARSLGSTRPGILACEWFRRVS